MEDRVEKARRLHRSGCNCCQSVVLAFADQLPIDEESASKVSAPFGRGLSGLHEVCGCVSGMAIVAGLTGHTADVKSLAEQFRQENGDVNCGRLLQQGKRPCNELVACAAGLVENLLNS